MQQNEDGPEDVRNATPVDSSVKQGEKDVLRKKKDVPSKPPEASPRHLCKREKPPPPPGRCEEKKKRLAKDAARKIGIYIHDPPCELTKIEIPPRQCFSKEEYIEYLATPKKKCDIPCGTKRVERRLLDIRPRIEELARPRRRKLMLTLQEFGGRLSPEQLEYLINVIEKATALTPEQAEDYLRDKAISKKLKKKKKRISPPADTCPSGNEMPTMAGGDPSLDLEAANCQYTMALRFVKSIICWKCAIPREQYRDLAEVVLSRLSDLLEYKPIGNEDRKSEQMRYLSDVFACWIAGVLMQVAELHRDTLQEECMRRQRELEDMLARQALEDEEEDEFGLGSGGSLADEEDEDELRSRLCTEVASLARTVIEEDIDLEEAEKSDVSFCADTSTQYDEVDEEELSLIGQSDVGTMVDDLESLREEDEMEEMESISEIIIELEDAESQTEIETADDSTDAEELKPVEQVCMESIASRMSCAFDADVPFITFAKIFDALYCMIECEKVNNLCDPVSNRIHRVIYEKFWCCMKDDPSVDEHTKDILDVVTGKLALWLRRVLNDKQLCFFTQNPPQIESREARDWSRWITNIADVAEDWSSWINKVTNEAQEIRQQGGITRGKWHEWTSKIETNAMLWRRTYLEAVHQEHHNAMMLHDRRVVKTGQKKKLEFFDAVSERAIRNTNYESHSKCR